MRLFVRSYITLDDLPPIALLIPEKLDTISAVVFFNRAEKIEILEDQFLAYIVYLENKKFLLLESGIGAYTLLSRINELKDKKVNHFLFINKGYSLNKKNLPGDIFLIKKSDSFAPRRTISVETELMKTLQKKSSIKTGKNLSMDINELFFKTNIKFKNKEIIKYDTLTTGDYYFLKMMKEAGLSGAAVNYLIGDIFQETAAKEKEYFSRVMNLVIKYLRN